MKCWRIDKVRRRISTLQPLKSAGSARVFPRRRTAAQLLSFVRRVHFPEGFATGIEFPMAQKNVQQIMTCPKIMFLGT
ncbi:MAG TPA: hypothetical protein DCM49_01845 [Lachnospiraceae bacterium]|nr:hypothetical protein [Lachnospiraceae bacterium]